MLVVLSSNDQQLLAFKLCRLTSNYTGVTYGISDNENWSSGLCGPGMQGAALGEDSVLGSTIHANVMLVLGSLQADAGLKHFLLKRVLGHPHTPAAAVHQVMSLRYNAEACCNFQ